MERLNGNRTAVIYLQSQAAPEVVRAVAAWAGQLSPQPPQMKWGAALLAILRVPMALECPEPVAVATALQRGYVAVLTDHISTPLLAPTTLELLLSGPKDVSLPPAVRRLVIWPRVVAALGGLLIGALLIAITGYHHTLLPGSFLVALAATRQNAPMPIAMEIFLISALSDAAQAAAHRLAGQRFLILAWIGTVLTIIGAMEVGVFGSISGIAVRP